MDQDELIKNLGTIAHSGSKEFLEALQSNGEKNEALIGKFGVGFYSVFMVSDSVKVYTRSWKKEGEGLCWESDGGGGYSIESVDGQRRGTKNCHSIKRRFRGVYQGRSNQRYCKKILCIRSVSCSNKW